MENKVYKGIEIYKEIQDRKKFPKKMYNLDYKEKIGYTVGNKELFFWQGKKAENGCFNFWSIFSFVTSRDVEINKNKDDHRP